MFTQDDLKNVEAALASGVLTLRLAGREVTYQSTSDLLKAREAIRKDLGKSRMRRIVVNYDKGLNETD